MKINKQKIIAARKVRKISVISDKSTIFHIFQSFSKCIHYKVYEKIKKIPKKSTF